MKAIITICLLPMALIGAGLILAVVWRLFCIGWRVGRGLVVDWVNNFFRK
jgi:hypothetical protein